MSKNLIYLAARYERRLELVEYAKELEKLGHKITSRWLKTEDFPKDADPQTVFDLSRKYAEDDLIDVENSDTVIVFTDKPKTVLKGGGMFVELGYAIAACKNVVIVGPRENIFCFFRDIKYQFDTWEQFLKEYK